MFIFTSCVNVHFHSFLRISLSNKQNFFFLEEILRKTYVQHIS